MARIDAVVDITPMALGEIHDAIVDGYTHDTLGQLLRYNWGLRLGDEFNVGKGLKYLVDDLVDFANRKGRVVELLALAYSGNSGNPELQRAATKYLADPSAALGKYGGAAPSPMPATLEALVNSHSRLFGFGEFEQRVHSLGSRLCRVEVPDGGGTGWLVGAGHALTNYHVAKRIIEGEVPSDQVACRFDFWAKQETDPTPEGTPVGIAEVVAYSKYSQSDVTGSGIPAESELDYALIKLAEPVGKSKGRDGTERGWFQLTPQPPIVARGDIAMIPQHPSGGTLKVAYGSIVDFPASGLRYRYDVTTEPGSSGSPVFTPDLSVFGLHHAAEPEQKPTYNQAVPLWRVAKDLETKQIEWAA